MRHKNGCKSFHRLLKQFQARRLEVEYRKAAFKNLKRTKSLLLFFKQTIHRLVVG